MERFEGSPRGVNGVLKAPDGLVVVGPCGVKGRRGRSLTSALREILGVIERVIVGAVLLFHVAGFEGCRGYERFCDVGRCGGGKGSERGMVRTAEGPCGEDEPPRSAKLRRHPQSFGREGGVQGPQFD